MPAPIVAGLASTRGSSRILRLTGRTARAIGPRSAVVPDAIGQHVVERHQPARPEQRERGLVVGAVGFLVGVDEGEVEGAGRLLDQRRQGLLCRRQAQTDARGDARLLPIAPCDPGPLLADVAGHQLAALRQRRGDAERAVAGEGADLERAPGADQPHQEGQERALIGRDLHAGRRQPRGLGAQAPLQVRLPHEGLVDVAGQFLGAQQGLQRHDISPTRCLPCPTDRRTARRVNRQSAGGAPARKRWLQGCA